MNGALPFVSVVVPAFERPQALSRAAAALARLDYPGFEVLVVDDGGRQPALVPDHPLFRVLRQDRQGPAAARNLGASQARGSLVAFLDDDCIPRPDWLRRLARRQAAVPGSAVGGRVVNGLPDDPRAEASQLLVDYLCAYYNQGPQARFATSNNLLFPTQGFLALGGFDPEFSQAGAEDRDLCARWTGSGRTLLFAEDAVVDHFHAMALPDFVRQHMRYGQGAHRFHRKRARTGSPLPEPLRFYLDLLRYPGRLHRGSLRLPLLMLLSQAANAAGFAHAALTRGLARAASPAPEPQP